VIGQVMGAVWQVVVSGTRQQQAEATEVLAETRRRLYGILADAGDDDEGLEDDVDNPGEAGGPRRGGERS
jgi:hypothetical protein